MINKTKRFEIRLTDKQYQNIKERAAMTKLTPSEYARRKIFAGEVGVMDALQFLKEYSQYKYEISKIGININQVAHYANVLSNQDQYSKKVVEEMTQLLNELIKKEEEIERLSKKILKV